MELIRGFSNIEAKVDELVSKYDSSTKIGLMVVSDLKFHVGHKYLRDIVRDEVDVAIVSTIPYKLVNAPQPTSDVLYSDISELNSEFANFDYAFVLDLEKDIYLDIYDKIRSAYSSVEQELSMRGIGLNPYCMTLFMLKSAFIKLKIATDGPELIDYSCIRDLHQTKTAVVLLDLFKDVQYGDVNLSSYQHSKRRLVPVVRNEDGSYPTRAILDSVLIDFGVSVRDLFNELVSGSDAVELYDNLHIIVPSNVKFVCKISEFNSSIINVQQFYISGPAPNGVIPSNGIVDIRYWLDGDSMLSGGYDSRLFGINENDDYWYDASTDTLTNM